MGNCRYAHPCFFDCLRMRAPALQLLSFSIGSFKEVKHSEPGSFRPSIGQFLDIIHRRHHRAVAVAVVVVDIGYSCYCCCCLLSHLTFLDRAAGE